MRPQMLYDLLSSSSEFRKYIFRNLSCCFFHLIYLFYLRCWYVFLPFSHFPSLSVLIFTQKNFVDCRNDFSACNIPYKDFVQIGTVHINIGISAFNFRYQPFLLVVLLHKSNLDLFTVVT